MTDTSKTRSAQKKKTTPFNAIAKRNVLRWIWISFAAVIIFFTLIFSLIALGAIGYLPPISDLQNPKYNRATEIYSSDMVPIGHFFISEGNRIDVSYEDLSPNLTQALIATEDVRFLNHSGIDGWAIGRAVILRGILQQKSAGGGSTITQQLAKQLWSPESHSFFQRLLQKPIEWVIAVKLEKYYTKEEIITMYLNKFDFLYNAVGIKTAAAVYFDTTPDKLDIQQAATLVGMLKNPSLYNPRRDSATAVARRNTVLSQMEKADFLTEEQRDSIAALPLVIHFNPIDHKSGLAPYFREMLRLMLTARKPDKDNYFDPQIYSDDSLQWENNPLYGFCHKNHKSDGSDYDLYKDGLKIYTTIDSRMQKYAEEAVSQHIQYLQGRFDAEKKNQAKRPFSRQLTREQIDASMRRSIRETERYRLLKKEHASDAEIEKAFHTPVKMRVFSYKGTVDTTMTPYDSIRYHKQFLRCGMMSMDPHNGHVKAYVGGPAFASFQYDMVSQGRRQVGSTIKPYLYTLAMEEGMDPCDQVECRPYTLIAATGQSWTPRNASRSHEGEMVTLRWGLANSNNWITAYLMSQYSPEALIRLMRSFGIQGKLDPVVSICLGPVEIKLIEMVDAYTAFANKGIRVDPLFVTRIEDKDGNVIANFSAQTHEVINENTAYKMIHMLRAVINQGTGRRVRARYNITADMGGKTGTSQNNSDGWFMGFTPSLVSGVWVGGEDRGIHFDSGSEGQGANMSLPIWALYMQKVYADPNLSYSQEERFSMPANMRELNGCLVEVADDNASDDVGLDE